MGSEAHVVVVGGSPGLIASAVRRIDDLERLWSRFLEDSEVSEMNRRAGQPVQVSAETAMLVERALDAWRLSAGSFDPTVLGAVVSAGYDRSFDLLATGGEPPSFLPGPPPAGAAGIEIEGRTVRLPSGAGFDPGGIGKGLAADLVAEEVIAGGAEGVCVNLGGDVRLSGAAPAGAAWTVAVEHPWSTAPIARLGLVDGAVATSTTLRRRWRAGGVTRHHLIDPLSGLPSDTDLNLATVVTARAWAAEVLAKAVLLRGSNHPFDALDGTGAQGLVVDDRGRVGTTPGLREFLGGRAPTTVEPVAVEPAPPAGRRVPGNSPAGSILLPGGDTKVGA
jgi:thiamine biosynthesis lipoprotein